MPHSAAFQRRKAGPWVIVAVPMDDEDWLYPSKRRFYGTHGGSVEHLHQAEPFTDLKDAKRKCNIMMDKMRNMWAEPIPLAMAWAIAHASTAGWRAQVPRYLSDRYAPKVKG